VSLAGNGGLVGLFFRRIISEKLRMLREDRLR
jgi:hypothetical protein